MFRRRSSTKRTTHLGYTRCNSTYLETDNKSSTQNVGTVGGKSIERASARRKRPIQTNPDRGEPNKEIGNDCTTSKAQREPERARPLWWSTRLTQSRQAPRNQMRCGMPILECQTTWWATRVVLICGEIGIIEGCRNRWRHPTCHRAC